MPLGSRGCSGAPPSSAAAPWPSEAARASPAPAPAACLCTRRTAAGRRPATPRPPRGGSGTDCIGPGSPGSHPPPCGTTEGGRGTGLGAAKAAYHMDTEDKRRRHRQSHGGTRRQPTSHRTTQNVGFGGSGPPVRAPRAAHAPFGHKAWGYKGPGPHHRMPGCRRPVGVYDDQTLPAPTDGPPQHAPRSLQPPGGTVTQ